MTISANKLDNTATLKVMAQEGAETLLACYTCGSCSSACPVEKVVEDFDPRKIVHMVGLGLGAELMASDIIWACSQCQSCIPVCPQNVRCADVIKALRDEAIQSGLVDEERRKELGLLAFVDPGKCVACLTCVRVCPFGAPRIVKEGYAFIDPDYCKACGICVKDCPAEAITLKPSLEAKEVR